MAFPTDDIYLGPATFGPRKGTEGLCWHTTEATSFSRAAAVGTANWQKTNPGSYNWIIYDGGLLLTVPYLEASGGLNPASSAWAPGRYPWLKSLHSAAAYADPNAYLLNVAFSGRTADILAGKMPANMYVTAARLTRWMEQQAWGKDNAVFSGHMHWQSNRSDPGQPTIDRILAEYAKLYDPPTIPVPPPDYQALYIAEQAKVTDLVVKLSAERAKTKTQAETIAGLMTKISAAKVALG
jgi:hypothetical protein